MYLYVHVHIEWGFLGTKPIEILVLEDACWKKGDFSDGLQPRYLVL
jgi:hypothetical protein